jgi:hypothetical protein
VNLLTPSPLATTAGATAAGGGAGTDWTAIAALGVSILAILVAIAVAVLDWQRHRKLDVPLLTVDLPAAASADESSSGNWADIPRAVRLTWAHGRLPAENVIVLQRLKRHLWISSLGPMGRESFSAPVLVQQWTEPDAPTRAALGLPDHPFLVARPTPQHPVDGDSAVGVVWGYGGRTDYWGRAIQQRARGSWSWAGNPVVSRRP